MRFEKLRAKYDYFETVSEKNYAQFQPELVKLQETPDPKDLEKAARWEWYHAIKIQAAHDMVKELGKIPSLLDMLGSPKEEVQKAVMEKMEVPRENVELLDSLYKEIGELGYEADDNVAVAMTKPKPALTQYRYS